MISDSSENSRDNGVNTVEEVSGTAVRQAAQRIMPYVSVSPIKQSVILSKRYAAPVYLKLENLNLSGSFKIRGAANALLQVSASDLVNGVIAASAGNHAQGVAYTCRLIGSRAVIFMPQRSPLVKVAATQELGAQVHLVGMNYDEAYAAALVWQKENGGLFLHGFHDPRVINGQGTVGLEVLDQVPRLGMVIASVGGGGLLAGVATAIKAFDPDVQVIGVQSAAYPAMQRSFVEQRLVACAAGNTIADGIAIQRPSDLTFEIIRRHVDDLVLVEEDEIASAVLDLMEREHMLAEGAGAAAVAALAKLSPESLHRLNGKSIACVISGGNIDVNLLKRIIPNGLKHSGRLCRFAIRIQDRPGRLAELLNIVSATGANLQEVAHNRLFGAVAYEDVEVQLDLETIDSSHQDRVAEALKSHKFKYIKLD